MFRTRRFKRAQAGFSIVELMVGTVVAMLAILVIFNAFAMFEGQKRSTTTTNDIQATGMLALQAIEREVRMAGYGMTVNNQIITSMLGCTTMNYYQAGTAYANPGVPFMPVTIADGGTGSDTITTLYATSPFASTPAMLASAITTSTLDPAVSNTASNVVFNVGDYVLLAQPLVTGRPCSRLRVTGTTNLGAVVTIQHATSDPANPPANIFPPAAGIYAAGYDDSAEAPTVVINMGAMPQAKYAVANNSLTYQNLNVAGSTAINLASGVVLLKAQYGISNAGSQPVTAWVEATGATWAAPTAANILRIKAVRVAVVVRSSLLEKDIATTTCTNNAGVNNGPCAWTDTAANPAPLIDLSADPNWAHYRYRVYETIIPLRNVIWANL